MTEHENETPGALLRDLTDGQRVVMHVSTTMGRLDARPLTVVEHEPDGTFRFLVDGTSEWVGDGPVLLAFNDEKDGRWLSASGVQRVVTDRTVAGRLWTPFARAWFEGPDDPRLVVVEVEVDEFAWWDSSSNRLVRTVKVAASAVKGPGSGGLEGDHGHERL